MSVRQLTELQIRGIRLLYSDGFSCDDLARMLNIKRTIIEGAIHQIKVKNDLVMVDLSGGYQMRQCARAREIKEIYRSIKRCERELKGSNKSARNKRM